MSTRPDIWLSSSSEDELCKVTDSFAPNLLACKQGLEAYNVWVEQVCDTQEEDSKTASRIWYNNFQTC